jgi:hypothetical protein
MNNPTTRNGPIPELYTIKTLKWRITLTAKTIKRQIHKRMISNIFLFLFLYKTISPFEEA